MDLLSKMWYQYIIKICLTLYFGIFVIVHLQFVFTNEMWQIQYYNWNILFVLMCSKLILVFEGFKFFYCCSPIQFSLNLRIKYFISLDLAVICEFNGTVDCKFAFGLWAFGMTYHVGDIFFSWCIFSQKIPDSIILQEICIWH